MSARRRGRSRTGRAAPPAPPPPAEAPRSRWIGVGLLAAVLVVGAGIRAWLSLTDDGIFWPDEIYQSLEPAHKLVFGTAIMPWEFLLGARTWAFPGLIAVLLKILDVVGLGDPRQYIDVTKLVFSAVSVATAYAAYRLARGYGASSLAAAAGASLYALASVAIYFAPRAFSETASALPATLGLALLLPPGLPRRRRLVGSVLLGLSVVLRLQNVILAVGVLGVLAWRKRHEDARDATIVLAAWAAFYGVLDLITWGGLFASVPLYLAVNMGVFNFTNKFGSAAVTTLPQWFYPPPYFFLQYLLASMALPFVVAVVLALFSARRASGLGLIALAYFVIHSFIPHKELRFVLPDLPVLGALAGIGIDEAPKILRRGRAWLSPALAAVLVLASAVSGATFHQLTFGELGIQGNRLVANAQEDLTVSKTPDSSAYDDPGAVNRLLLVAHGLPDLCGIKVESVLPEFQGGYTYLDRNVPLYRLGGPPRTSTFYNYAIVLRGTEAGAHVTATEGDMSLIRLRSSCTTDPKFDSQL